MGGAGGMGMGGRGMGGRGGAPCAPADDMNDCTEDLCQDGAPTHLPKMEGAPCASNGGAVCDGEAQCVACNKDSDCADPMTMCSGGACVAMSCSDGMMNGAETDMDCGGPDCGPCADNLLCQEGSDCESQLCVDDGMGALRCAPPACGDGMKNGEEACDDGGALAGDGCAADCTVEAGYTCNDANPSACADIDECQLGTSGCAAEEMCINLPGTFECTGGSSGSGSGTTTGTGGPPPDPTCMNGAANGACEPGETCSCADCATGPSCTATCVPDNACTLDDDCVCDDCDNDSFCGDPSNCLDDGTCDFYSEGCVCADCAAHPVCAP